MGIKIMYIEIGFIYRIFFSFDHCLTSKFCLFFYALDISFSLMKYKIIKFQYVYVDSRYVGIFLDREI